MRKQISHPTARKQQRQGRDPSPCFPVSHTALPHREVHLSPWGLPHFGAVLRAGLGASVWFVTSNSLCMWFFFWSVWERLGCSSCPNSAMHLQVVGQVGVLWRNQAHAGRRERGPQTPESAVWQLSCPSCSCFGKKGVRGPHQCCGRTLTARMEPWI